jgi:hypothetical protein
MEKTGSRLRQMEKDDSLIDPPQETSESEHHVTEMTEMVVYQPNLEFDIIEEGEENDGSSDNLVRVPHTKKNDLNTSLSEDEDLLELLNQTGLHHRNVNKNELDHKQT